MVLFLGRNVKEYITVSEKIIQELLKSGIIRCEECLQPMKRHSGYERGIKETGQKIAITMAYCGKCKKHHALLPDFILPRKHYSGNEIESVIIDSETATVNEIETEASEITARRWIAEIGERIKRAIGVLKYLFARMGKTVSELTIQPGAPYNELEQLLEKAPDPIKSSGNKLGLANLWLGTSEIKSYI